MMAITTSSSIKVKPSRLVRDESRSLRFINQFAAGRHSFELWPDEPTCADCFKSTPNYFDDLKSAPCEMLSVRFCRGILDG